MRNEAAHARASAGRWRAPGPRGTILTSSLTGTSFRSLRLRSSSLPSSLSRRFPPLVMVTPAKQVPVLGLRRAGEGLRSRSWAQQTRTQPTTLSSSAAAGERPPPPLRQPAALGSRPAPTGAAATTTTSVSTSPSAATETYWARAASAGVGAPSGAKYCALQSLPTPEGWGSRLQVPLRAGQPRFLVI